MKENGELEYNGRRSVSTRRMEMEQVAHAMPVIGYVACGEGMEETEQDIDIYFVHIGILNRFCSDR